MIEKKLMCKLKEIKGESIAETLVALLIAALALLLLAGMVQTSSRLITKSKEQIEKFVEIENGIAEGEDFSEEGTVYLSKIGDEGNYIKLNRDGKSVIPVFYRLDKIGGREIISFMK